jgi:hypothetical protein
LVNEAQLDSIRNLPGARLHVFPLSLQEILLAFLQKGPPYESTDRFGGGGAPRSRQWNSASDFNL